jgi:hypothetical protein
MRLMLALPGIDMLFLGSDQQMLMRQDSRDDQAQDKHPNQALQQGEALDWYFLTKNCRMGGKFKLDVHIFLIILMNAG